MARLCSTYARIGMTLCQAHTVRSGRHGVQVPERGDQRGVACGGPRYASFVPAPRLEVPGRQVPVGIRQSFEVDPWSVSSIEEP